jgi:acetolactate synthase-1/2/3 large subunit
MWSSKIKMLTTDYIVKFLKAKGVEFVFELSGGMIMQLIDSIHLDGSIKLVTVHHEQASSFAADAVGRMLGKPGFAIATSGPGATNLLTGIGSCYFDSSPAVFITGQVNTSEQKGDRPIRQLGFQETDIVSMAKPITKFCHRVVDAAEIPMVLERAYRIAISGRPGPVLIDIPMDVFRSTINSFIMNEEPSREEFRCMSEGLLDALINKLKDSSRPLILAGGGINAAGIKRQFQVLVDRLKVPVVYSLHAVDVLDVSNPLRLGFIGTYGNRWANTALHQADFVLVLGSRLDIRQTGADTVSFKTGKTIYHVDCEVGEINNRVDGCIPIVVNLKEFIEQFNFRLESEVLCAKPCWVNSLSALKECWPDTAELVGVSGINPNKLMRAISQPQYMYSAYVADVGLHQMWAAQSLQIKPGERFITSGGMGAMGFALPAAIGVSLCDPEKPVCMIAGDGGFQLNIQELQTVFRNDLCVKMVILNNNCHGMTRQFQDTYYGKRYQSTMWGYSAPDFSKIANAYSIDSLTISREDEIDGAVQAMYLFRGPFLLQVMIDSYTNAYPKLAFGLPISEMEPLAKPKGMEST